MRGPVSTIIILTADLVAVQSADPAEVAFVSGRHGRAVVKPSNPRDQAVRIRRPLRCNRSGH